VQETTDLLIQSIAQRDQALVEALSRDWDKGRFPDSAAKSEPVFDLRPKDQLLFEWVQAARYSTSLANHPERFHQILTTHRASTTAVSTTRPSPKTISFTPIARS
jgi:hypothetical protein